MIFTSTEKTENRHAFCVVNSLMSRGGVRKNVLMASKHQDFFVSLLSEILIAM